MPTSPEHSQHATYDHRFFTFPPISTSPVGNSSFTISPKTISDPFYFFVTGQGVVWVSATCEFAIKQYFEVGAFLGCSLPRILLPLRQISLLGQGLHLWWLKTAQIPGLPSLPLSLMLFNLRNAIAEISWPGASSPSASSSVLPLQVSEYPPSYSSAQIFRAYICPMKSSCGVRAIYNYLSWPKFLYSTTWAAPSSFSHVNVNNWKNLKDHSQSRNWTFPQKSYPKTALVLACYMRDLIHTIWIFGSCFLCLL